VRQSLLEQYGCPPERVQCVYFGSNAVRQPLAPDNAGYTNKTILFVGIDWQRKGGPELVAAFREVLRVHPDARLIIVGCSPKVEVPNCEVVGKIPLAAVSRYYAQASIFCLPTKLEPAGVAFIEALLSRLPIVATRLGAVPDFVEDGRSGCLVAPGDVGQLAEVLLFLLDRPETCRAFGERGLALALDRYRWEQVGRRLREGIQAALPVGASG
jgi:glycosyltransferase involved in cell wall biosynthesis